MHFGVNKSFMEKIKLNCFRALSLVGLFMLCSLSCYRLDDKKKVIMDYVTPPDDYAYTSSVANGEKYFLDSFDVEYYTQTNGPGTLQRVMMVFPKNYSEKVPAVVVPFYFPEAMIGIDPRTGESLPKYYGIEIMTKLAERGIASISAESYHLTYIKSDKDRDDFTRWEDAGQALLKDYPQWSGVGKLVYDTRLLVDILEGDPRIDRDKIGIAGHSLGGKMAFYTGCLDPRIKVILASDFGFLWEQTNWEKCWYWGDKLNILKEKGIDNTVVLSMSGGKSIFLIAGEADNENSYEAMLKAKGYEKYPQRLGFFNHASGHRPTAEALEKGLDFLEEYLRNP